MVRLHVPDKYCCADDEDVYITSKGVESGRRHECFSELAHSLHDGRYLSLATTGLPVTHRCRSASAATASSIEGQKRKGCFDIVSPDFGTGQSRVALHDLLIVALLGLGIQKPSGPSAPASVVWLLYLHACCRPWMEGQCFPVDHSGLSSVVPMVCSARGQQHFRQPCSTAHCVARFTRAEVLISKRNSG